VANETTVSGIHGTIRQISKLSVSRGDSHIIIEGSPQKLLDEVLSLDSVRLKLRGADKHFHRYFATGVLPG
jgi:hypothetical protein